MTMPKLEVIAGCMFAGKTRALVRRVRMLQEEHQLVHVFKPAIDNRFSVSDIVSHDGTRQRAGIVPTDDEYLTDGPGIVCVDEVQFLSSRTVDRLMTLLRTGAVSNAILAGLDLTWRGEPFGQMARLLCLADRITKLQAICACCGAPATRTFLADRSVWEGTVVIGGAEKYEPRCFSCFEDGMRGHTTEFVGGILTPPPHIMGRDQPCQ